MKLNKEVTEKLIKKSGRSQAQFCRDIGIEKYNLSKYMHGANIPMKTLYKIADNLGVSAFDIMKLGSFDY